jgi:hypothetical protein
MAFGSGTFTVQNKILPGAYMNFVSAARADSSLSERGIAALPLQLPSGPEGVIFSVRADDFMSRAPEIFGCSAYSDDLILLREALKHAREVLVYRVGINGEPADDEYMAFLQALESRSFHTLGLPVNAASPLKKAFADFTRRMRESAGSKIQCVLYKYTEADHEGVISVDNAPELVCWVSGAAAGAAPGRSLINTVYDGELEIDSDHTSAQLEALIRSGAFVFHRVGGTTRVLEDINTLTTLSLEKNRDFQDNMTIRLIDQIASDIAGMFNDRYLGKTANDAAGRVALWSDIVAHHRRLEQLGAIESFEPEDVIVEQGDTKKSVIVRDCVTPVGAMAQLYMTVVIS